MTRDEHIAFCKKRAHEYLSRGDVVNAIASMMSDLDKHEGTKAGGKAMAPFGLLCAMNNDHEGARRFIDGFN
jgi:hypothetical protein